MTDTNPTTSTAPGIASTSPTDTTQPPYYFPAFFGHPDRRVIHELSLYVTRRVGETQFVHVLGN